MCKHKSQSPRSDEHCKRRTLTHHRKTNRMQPPEDAYNKQHRSTQQATVCTSGKQSVSFIKNYLSKLNITCKCTQEHGYSIRDVKRTSANRTSNPKVIQTTLATTSTRCFQHRIDTNTPDQINMTVDTYCKQNNKNTSSFASSNPRHKPEAVWRVVLSQLKQHETAQTQHQEMGVLFCKERAVAARAVSIFSTVEKQRRVDLSKAKEAVKAILVETARTSGDTAVLRSGVPKEGADLAVTQKTSEREAEGAPKVGERGVGARGGLEQAKDTTAQAPADTYNTAAAKAVQAKDTTVKTVEDTYNLATEKAAVAKGVTMDTAGKADNTIAGKVVAEDFSTSKSVGRAVADYERRLLRSNLRLRCDEEDCCCREGVCCEGDCCNKGEYWREEEGEKREQKTAPQRRRFLWWREKTVSVASCCEGRSEARERCDDDGRRRKVSLREIEHREVRSEKLAQE
ncbi:hypothetical protein KC19_VG300600 [Ceratodon purpureus]|uniref:Uncharacterized protein n=1 Tax=Ceratodon purpureus TaxID=3225 RepID=A0A8T0HW33_CERPU|nr:hypothetical protein KC19_VG300600 [Ceratodon purpureus]